MIICPIPNEAWNLLIQKVGKDEADRIFVKNGFKIPSLEEVQKIEENPITLNTTKEGLEKWLIGTGLFQKQKSTGRIIPKAVHNINFSRSIAALGDLNTLLGRPVAKRVPIGKSFYVNLVDTFGDQSEIKYDLIGEDKVDFKLKSIEILQSPKADEIFRKGDKNNWSIEKIMQELAIPKEQQELIKSFNTRNREQILTSLLANYSYTIEINTAQDNQGDNYEYTEEGEPILQSRASRYYSNLTVPGGTNYTENEIATPGVEVEEKPQGIAPKQGVEELFDSNPELANQVYEILGFDNTVTSKVILQKKFADTYNIIYNNETIGTIDIPSDLEGDTISIGDVNIKQEFRGKGIGVETYKAAMQIADKPLESFMATDEANRVWNSLIKQGLAKKTETGFISINNQITPQQKQQAQQLYSQYLDTIFPDSKVKDIVYRGDKSKTINGVTQFLKGERKDLLFLSSNKEVAKNTLYHSDFSEFIYKKDEFGNLTMTSEYEPDESKGLVRGPKNFIAAVVNVKTPLIKNANNQSYRDYKIDGKNEYETIKEAKEKIKNKEIDSLIVENVLEGDVGKLLSTNIAIKEPEQIHILGSKQDIEEFKNWIKDNTKTVKEGAITPSIKGHAQFATDNGIGWFRSDDKEMSFESSFVNSDGSVENIFDKTKTRRILEVQSDLFQKGRDKKDLISKEIENGYETSFTRGSRNYFGDSYSNEFWYNENGKNTFISLEEYKKAKNTPDNSKENQFLQLLNKDNNWVTFFIKSIIQDSAKKGYEKVLFPTGNTASKVEGHTTLEEFKKQKEDRIKELETSSILKNKTVDGFYYIQRYLEDENGNEVLTWRKVSNETGREKTATTEEINQLKERFSDETKNEINQLKQELERVETEGFGALKPIYNFYENTVTNILNKTYGKENVKVVTDEYGNTWNEIILTNTQNSTILLDLIEGKESNLLLKGFKDFHEQRQVINVLTSSILAFRLSNVDKKAGIFKSAVNNFVEEIKKANEVTPNPIYDTILNNIRALGDYAYQKLEALDLIPPKQSEGTLLEKTINKTEKEEQEEGINDSEAIGDYNDSWVFAYDSKANALKAVKTFLAFTPKTTYREDLGQYRLVKSIVPGQPDFYSYDEIYEQLKAILSDVDNTWEAMEAELKKYEKAKPFIHTILLRLANYKGDTEQLKRQFVSTMSGTHNEFKTFLIEEQIKTIEGQEVFTGFKFKLINTDRNTLLKVIESKWSSDYSRTNVANNKDVRSAYLAQLEEVSKNPTLAEVKSLLKDIGINLTDSSLKQLVEGTVNKLPIKLQFTAAKGLFTIVKQRLTENKELTKGVELTESTDNPIVNSSGMRALARIEANNADYAYSNTLRNGEGNLVQSYSFNKYLTKEYQKLIKDPAYVSDLLEITFNKPIQEGNNLLYETWLYLLNNQEEFKSVFSVSPFDTTKLSISGKDGVTLNKMSELDLELTRLGLIQNSGNRKRGLGINEAVGGTRIVNYLLTIPAKSTSYIIQGAGHDTQVFFRASGPKLGKDTLNALYSIAATEHNRILSHEARKTANKAFSQGSKMFFFFPSLNDIVIKDGKVLLPTDKIGDKTVEQLIKEEIEKVVQENLTKTLNNWKGLGIIKDNELKYIDSDYFNKVVKPNANTSQDQITYAALDSIVNSMLAKFNTHQLFIDDPALYFKKSKQGSVKANVKETWDNIEKRLTSLTAPFKEGMLDSTNRKFLSIKLQDRKVNALNLSQLEARLNKIYGEENPYKGITGTDAQEYVTLKEELKGLYSNGEITTKLYNEILNRYSTEGDNLILTKKELGIVLGARKPVYSNRVVSKANDTVYKEYVKSSSIVLLPQFTKGLEIDKLRVGMEKLENKNLTARAVYDSGTKLGGQGSVDIWNSDGTIKDNLDLAPYAVELDRSNLGIQQEVPYDEKKDEIVSSTQVLKLIFDSVEGLVNFRYNGSNYTGTELKSIYTNLRAELYKKGLNKLESRLIEDGKFIMSELIPLLYEEGVKRGYSPAQLSFIEQNLEKTDFALPFWSHVNNDKEQAMITSLWTNNVLRQKMPGGSYVLVSEEGVKGRNLNTLYTEGYDPNTGLKPMRVVYKKDTEILEEEEWKKLSKEERSSYKEIIKPAQVILSWNIRGKNGKLLNQADYTIVKDGISYVDTSKLPKELLNQFGFRIPNQGFNSMSLIEIVGFLPDVYAGIVIASRNFVVQMGSDFDIDKLYIYNYAHDTDADGKLLKEKDNVQNQLVDIHKSVLYNPALFNRVIKPLDVGKIADIVKEIKKIEEAEINNYANTDYDTSKYLQSIDGKAMVGLTSVGNVFNALIQNKNLYLQEQVGEEFRRLEFIFNDKEGKEVKVSDLSSPLTIYGRNKNEIHQGIQSAAVDNEKDPLLSYINISAETSSVMNLMIALGLEEEDIYYFTAQPILKRYAKQLKQTKSSVATEFITADVILDNLVDRQLQEQLIVKIKNTDLSSVAIGPKDYKFALLGVGESIYTKEEIQQLVLEKFKRMKPVADLFQRAQNILNVESKGAGKGFIDLSEKVRSIEKVLATNQIVNLSSVVGELQEGELTPTTITGHAIVNGIFSANDTLVNSKMLPVSSEYFTEQLKSIEQVIGKDATADNKYKYWVALKSYVLSGFFTDEERKSIFFDSATNKSLNTRIDNLLNTKLKGNSFITRLDLSPVDVTGNTPSLIFYNSAKEEDIEDLNIYQDLYNLVFNADPQVADIGKDLIKYFFINGAQQSAKDWGRYISVEMMEAIGLDKYVKSIDFTKPDTYGAGKGISESVVQFFQHAPYLVKEVPKEKIAFKDNLALVKKDNIPAEILEGVNSSVSLFRVGYNLYRFKSNNQSNTGYIYELLPKRGRRFYNEYSMDTTFKVVSENPINKKLEQIQAPVNPVTPSVDTFVNPVVEAAYTGLLDTTLEVSLSNINSTEYNKKLASFFQKLTEVVPSLKDTNVNVLTTDAVIAGRYNTLTGDIGINVNQLQLNNKATREYIERTILKETVHALMHKLYRQDFTPTQEQIAAKAALNDLFNNVITQVQNGESAIWKADVYNKFSSILEESRKSGRLEANQLKPEDEKFLKEHKDLYYGLTNVEDFIHEALLQEGFRDALNKLNYDKDKSFLDRVIDLIQTVLNEFRKLANIKQDSALEEVFTQLLRISTKETVSKPESTKFTYNKEQLDAIYNAKEFIKKGDKRNSYYVIEGKAGTGKTTIAKEIVKEFKNKNIVISALSHKAKAVLSDKFKEANIPAQSYSIAGLLGMQMDIETGIFTRPKKPSITPIEDADILLVDEASMINEEVIELIMRTKPKNTSVIFLGDIGQLPPIRSVSNPYYAGKTNLTKKSPVFENTQKSRLLERVRQGEESPILPFADAFWANSQISTPVANPQPERESKITSKGNLLFVDSFSEIAYTAVDSFKEAINKNNPNHIKIVVYRNNTRTEINNFVHNAIFGKDSQPYNVGELLIFNDTFDEIIENATEVQVIKISETFTDSEGLKYINVEAIDAATKKVLTFPVLLPSEKSKFDLKVSKLFNEAKAQKNINYSKYLSLLRDAWTFKRSYPAIDYGYAITSHKSQGSTYDIVIVDEQDINNVGPIGIKEKSESIYTALTRARTTTVVISAFPYKGKETQNLEDLTNSTELNKDDIYYDLSFDSTEEDNKFKRIENDYAVRLVNISESIVKAEVAKDTELVTELKIRLNEVKAERDELVKDTSLEAIYSNGVKDIEKVELLLEKGDLTPNDLGYARLVLGTWTKVTSPDTYNLISVMDIETNSPRYREFKELSLRAKGIEERLNVLQVSILHKLAEAELEKPISRDSITTVTDISKAQSQFRDIATSDNVVLHVMDKWIRKAEFNTTTELNKIIKKAEELSAAIAEKGVKTREDYANTFGQLNKDGELTGRLVSPLSDAYYKKRELLLYNLKEAPNPGEKKKRAIEYYDWIKENHIIVDLSILYNTDNDGKLVAREDKNYLEVLKEQLGTDYKATIDRAKELVNEYNQELEEQLKYWEGEGDRTIQLEVWQLEHSPLVYLQNLKEGLTIRKIGDKTVFNKGWKYIAKRAKQEWEDSRYNTIQQDKDLKAYYDWYSSTLRELYNYLPYNIRKYLLVTEIPNIEKTLVQELHDAGIAKYINRSWSALLDEVSVSNGDYKEYIDPTTGQFKREFKFAYLDKLNPEDKSYDLTQTLKLFAAQSLGFKNKAVVEDQVRLAEAVLKESMEKQLTPDGLPKTDKFGNTTTTKGLKNLYDQVDYVMDVFYGQRKDTKEGRTAFTYITPRDKERIEREKEKLKELNLSEAQQATAIKELEAKYKRRFSWSAFGDTLLQYIQLKGMGWNIFGGVNNMLFGQMANYNWAAAGTDFSDEDMSKAVATMLSFDKDTTKKVENLMTKFNTVKQLRDKIYSATSNYNKARKGINKLAPYEVYAKGEYFVQGQVMVALLLGTKVSVIEKGEQKTISLYEAFDTEGNWNEERFGKNDKWTDTGNSTANFKFKLDTLLKKIHGNYDPGSAILINKKFLGRALIQFRRWIPEGVAQRFDSEKYDTHLQRSVKGRYATYYDLGFKQSLKTLAKTALYRGKDKAFDDLQLSEDQLAIVKENMKKNLREIYYKLSLMGLYLILSGLDDDDEEWTRAAKNYSFNTILRLQDDIEFYYSPVAFENITRSTLPIMGIVTDSYKFMDAFVDTLQGEGTYKNGVHSGDQKMFWRGMKLIPFGSSLTGLINKTETTESYRK